MLRARETRRACDGSGRGRQADRWRERDGDGLRIHAGRTRTTGKVERPLSERSARVGSVLGTYLHGLFANESVRAAFLEQVRETAGVDPPEKAADERTPYETAASLIGRLDLENAITSDGQQ